MIKHEFLSTAEAAKFLGIPEKSVRKLARDGDIPAYRFGKLWKFDIKELRDSCANSYPRR